MGIAEGIEKKVAKLEERFLRASRKRRYEDRRLNTNVISISDHGLSAQDLDNPLKRKEVVIKLLEVLDRVESVTLITTEKFLTKKGKQFNLKGSKINVNSKICLGNARKLSRKQTRQILFC